MERQSANSLIKNSLEEYLRLHHGIYNPKKAFKCLNPEHADNNPSMSIDRTGSAPHAHCFSCGAHYDTFDIVGIDYNLTDPREIFQKAYEIFNIDIDRDSTYRPDPARVASEFDNLDNAGNVVSASAPAVKLENGVITPKGQQNEPPAPPKVYDFNGIVNKCSNAVFSEVMGKDAKAYFNGRGLSDEIIKRYRLGYCPAGYNRFTQEWPELENKSYLAPYYKYILPFPGAGGACNYAMLEITDRKRLRDGKGKYWKLKGVKMPLLNEYYLSMEQPPEVITICEGYYDALSIEQSGGHAIALLGLGYNRLLDVCKAHKPSTTFILCLDNDEAGQCNVEKFTSKLKELGISCITHPIPDGKGKDFNEFLQADPEGLKMYVAAAENDAAAARAELEQAKQAEERAARDEYLLNSVAVHLPFYIERIVENGNQAYFPTGFSSLDKILDGGLFAGLYVVGAISSLGKTTFSLQIADNIAAAGQDVLIFSLEMAREELMTKSLSRYTFQQSQQQGEGTRNAYSVRTLTHTIRNGWTYDGAIMDAIAKYMDGGAKHIYINEGIGDIGAAQVRETVEKHIRYKGNKPVVIIDYLQILAPYNERMSDKQNVDKNVLELKRLSRDKNIPVLAISSFNRESYTAPVNMAAFKESGAVEYSSDVLIGLQYMGMDYLDGETDKGARPARIRALTKDQHAKARAGGCQQVQVKILKNRNGSKGDTVLDFYPMFNYFQETKQGEGELSEPPAWTPRTIRNQKDAQGMFDLG